MAPAPIFVRVTNGNKFDLEDRFDGIAYDFPSGKPVLIPLEAANHIFGYDVVEGSGEVEALRAAMETHCSRRFGWSSTDWVMDPDSKQMKNLGRARVYFKALKFEARTQRIVEEPMGGEELPAPRAGASRAEAAAGE